jgi:hypothetical protein
MFHKIAQPLIILVCLALIIPILNCAPQSSSKLELQLEKAPRLNEPVKITCIRQTKDFVPPGQVKKASDNVTQMNIELIPPKHEKIILEFERVDPKTYSLIKVPAKEVLVSSNLNWEGDITGQPLDFSATIKFPYEGNWGIYATSMLHPQDEDAVFLNVTEDSSSFGWPKDYRPITSPFPSKPTDKSPITVELDIPKPPLLNDPGQLTWSLNSIRDIEGVIGEVAFYRMEGTDSIKVTAEDILIEGDLTWKGTLKQDSRLHLSATIKFPQEGDWHILATADSYAEPQPINSGSGLYLHVDKDKSRWGWTESHEKPYEGPPPLPDNPR